MKHLVFLTFSIASYLNGFSSVLIKIKMKTYDTMAVSYYKPFKGFANDAIRTEYNPKAYGDFSYSIKLNSATFIRFNFDNVRLELLCEPNDTLTLYVSRPLSLKDDWVIVDGNNSKGHMHFNNIYNRIRANKLFDMQDVFEPHFNEDPNQLFERLRNEILKNTNWLEPLVNSNQISKVFYDYMKLNIEGVLAWQIGELCRKHYDDLDSNLSLKSTRIQNLLFNLVNPLDSKLRNCFTSGYYNTYFSELHKRKTIEDSTTIIVKDTPFYSLASKDLQSFLWGRSLYAHYLYDPDRAENCKSFKRYKDQFVDGDFIDFFKTSDICEKTIKQPLKFIKSFDSDLFSFLEFNFPRKRVFVDIWATWCAPCKMEFKFYDAAFYEFMKEHKIELVFISIDDPKRRDQWEREVNTFNLKGNHILAQTHLQASLKEVVYDDGNVVIPRYLLADETGKILSTDFMRPSDPQFQNEIRKQFR